MKGILAVLLICALVFTTSASLAPGDQIRIKLKAASFDPVRPSLTGIPDDLNDLFLQAYNDSARVHSNSWGWSPGAGEYSIYSQQVDQFVWNHTDMIIVFAAGNDGRDTPIDGNGTVDNGSIEYPATAKNCIAVGATENYRPTIINTYGSFWSTSFPYDPIKGDRISNNSNGIAAFSSRGPCDDGRIKPDLVAPGTAILSTRSSFASSIGYGLPSNLSYNSSLDPYYFFNMGTSMATPLVAGSAAVVRQYYVDVEEQSFVSAALVKATLINGAYNMTPGQYAAPKNDVTRRPDNNQGWGRVDLENSIFPKAPASLRFIDNTTDLTTGQNASYSYFVWNSSVPLRITLVWSDYPSNPAAAKNLVNDLDLIIIHENGSSYHGNDFSPPYNDTRDSTNNVEGIELINPLAGNYTIKVNGTNVPFGPQKFALAFSGGFSADIALNKTSYYTNETLGITVRDPEINNNSTSSETLTVNVSSAGDSEVVTLTEKGPNSGIFTGLIQLSNSTPSIDGKLQVSPGNTITASYNETAPAGIRNATAAVLNTPPVLESIGNRTIIENQTLFIALNASDIDNQTLIFSCNRTDLFADFNTTTGKGNWTANYSSAGSYQITFGVSDEIVSDNETVTVAVGEIALNITSYWNNRTGANLSVTIEKNETIEFGITANRTANTTWYCDDVEVQNSTLLNFTRQFNASGMHLINASAYDSFDRTSNITFRVAVGLPAAAYWWNSKTANSSREITMNQSEVIELGVIYNQTGNITWNATDFATRYNNTTSSGNQSYSWTSTGNKQANATLANENGTATVNWNVTVRDITPPTISNVSAQSITTSAATITWNTSEPSSSLVRYGTASGSYAYNRSSSENVTLHSISLSGLSSSTKYYFVVNSSDPWGNSNESTEHNFTTAAATQTSDGDGGGGGGGGGAAIGEPYENVADREVQYAWAVKPGRQIVVQFKKTTHPVLSISFAYSQVLNEVSVTVEELLNTSTFANGSPPGYIYKHFNIWVSVPNAQYLSNATANLSVEKSWMQSNKIDPESIALYRFKDGAWNKIPAAKVFENEASVVYFSSAPGFSPFAIAGETEPKPVPASATPSTPTPAPTMSSTPLHTQTPSKPKETQTPGQIPGFDAAIAISSLALAYLRGRKKM